MQNYLNEFRFMRCLCTANRIAQLLLGLLLIAGLNIIAAKYFKRIDLTHTGAYTLAAESKAYIRQLEEPVNIIVTIPEKTDMEGLKTIREDIEKLLREYEFFSTRGGTSFINVEFVDIYRQRVRAQEIAAKYDITQENVIIVAAGERICQINTADLYEYSGEEIRSFRGEQLFTSAILEVASKKPQKIYFLVGHGEMRTDDVDKLRGLSQLDSFLRERNFELATLDLAIEANVPADASLLILASPQASLQAEEVEKLRRYMNDHNGRMIILIDPGRRHGMEELFYDWGVLAEDTTVIDTGVDSRAQGGDLIIRRFAEHPITQLLIDDQITVLFGQPRSIRPDPVADNDSRLQVIPLMGTSEKSWSERDYRTQDPPVFDSKRDQRGPVVIATVSTRSSGTEIGITIPGGRMIVFGNSDFISNNRLQVLGNRTLLNNSINWALDRDNLLDIPIRKLKSYQIVVSEGNLQRMRYFFAVIPITFAGFGLLVFLIRRH